MSSTVELNFLKFYKQIITKFKFPFISEQEIILQENIELNKDIKSNETNKLTEAFESGEGNELNKTIKPNETKKLNEDIKSNENKELTEDLKSSEDNDLNKNIKSNENKKLSEIIKSSENKELTEAFKSSEDNALNKAITNNYKYNLPEILFENGNDKAILKIILFIESDKEEKKEYEFLFYVYKGENPVYIGVDYPFKRVYQLIIQSEQNYIITLGKEKLDKLATLNNKYRKQLNVILE